MRQPSIKPYFSIHHQLSQLHHWIPVKHAGTMEMIGHEIEHTLMADAGDTCLFIGVQSFSAFLPQAARYRDIAKRIGTVYVLGAADIRPESVDGLPDIDNLIYVPLLPNSQLSRERFLMCSGRTFASVLSSEEASEGEFSCVWIFDPAMANRLAARLVEQIGEAIAIPDEAQVNERAHAQHMNYLSFRMMSRLVGGETEDLLVSQEVRRIIKHTLQPYVADILGNLSAGV